MGTGGGDGARCREGNGEVAGVFEIQFGEKFKETI